MLKNTKYYAIDEKAGLLLLAAHDSAADCLKSAVIGREGQFSAASGKRLNESNLLRQLRPVQTITLAELQAYWQEAQGNSRYLWKSAAGHIVHVLANESPQAAYLTLSKLAKEYGRMAVSSYYESAAKDLKQVLEQQSTLAALAA